MKFEKLNFAAFSKSTLSNNTLRSLTGGEIPTSDNCDDPKARTDSVDKEGCTHWSDGGSDCDTDICK